MRRSYLKVSIKALGGFYLPVERFFENAALAVIKLGNLP